MLQVETPAEAARSPLWRDIALGLAVFGVYVAVALDASAEGRRDFADSNARALLDVERWLHIDVERSLNQWLGPRRVLTVLANYEYAYTYIISAFLLLAWLYLRLPADYRRARDSFILLNLIAIACFAVFPVTPPRLLPGMGYVDTVAQGGTFGSWGTPLVSSANQYAAMPSLHLAWALWVSVVLARLARGVAVQLLSAIHVAVTVFVIVATANHWVLDAVAAIPLVWVSVVMIDRRQSVRGSSLVPAADAFFLHVETDSAPQHVGGMVVLAPSSPGRPTLEEIRELLRAELPNMPRFRQRPEQPSSARRWRWVDVDPADIDWDWHVSERPAAGGADATDVDGAAAVLSRTVAQVATERLPRDRPMWRIILVRDIAPGRSGLLFLVHHCVADGVGTVLQALNILQPRLNLAADGRSQPGILRRAVATIVGLVQLATDGRPAAKLKDGSARRGFATTAFDLSAIRTVARERGVRVTDVLLGLLAVGVRRTHPELSAAVGHRLRVSVPIMLREPHSAAAGNLTAAAMVDLPLTDTVDDVRLREISHATARLRTPTRALASRFVMATVLGLCPVGVHRWFARKVYGPAFLQAIVSNMPGPEPAMSIAGIPLDRVVPILPLAPGAPIALGALSWTGVLGVGLAVDAELVDGDRVVVAMAQAFTELRALDVNSSSSAMN